MEHRLDSDQLQQYNQEIFAKAAIETLFNVIQASEEKDAFEKAFLTKKHLLDQNKGNTYVKNALDYFLANLPQKGIKDASKAKYKEVLRRLAVRKEGASKVGEKKIKENSRVFLHSLDNNTYSIIKEASRKKRFTVNLLEHSPHKLGKHMHEEFSRQKIDSKLYADLDIFSAISNSDICLIGARAVTKDKNAICKIGSRAASEIGLKHNIPVYVSAPSFSYDHDGIVEKNQAGYEEVKKENITAYITEHGIISPKHFSEELMFHDRWLFY